jgi:hypothetical protein
MASSLLSSHGGVWGGKGHVGASLAKVTEATGWRDVVACGRWGGYRIIPFFHLPSHPNQPLSNGTHLEQCTYIGHPIVSS